LVENGKVAVIGAKMATQEKRVNAEDTETWHRECRKEAPRRADMKVSAEARAGLWSEAEPN
jgi:hypothetical protein